MLRIRFTKEGNAVWISHLDLMRLLQRAFRRAGILLKHSQGYSPHPELSILLPLSVGVSSQCELADFSLDEEDAHSSSPVEQIPALLNPVLPAGIRVLECYEGGQKPGRIGWLKARLTLCYDGGIPDGAEDAIAALFARKTLPVEKHSKKGPVEVDILPMLRELHLQRRDEKALVLEAMTAAQNPTLNPLLLVTAIEGNLPELKPDFTLCRRIELYDTELEIFQ